MCVPAITADSDPYKILLVSGTVTLVRQDTHAGYAPALIFQLQSGEVAYLTRSDDRWWLPWQGLRIASRWPTVQDYTVFASDYTGFEFLGNNGGELMSGYRDNVGHWHNPVPVLVGNDPVIGVTGRPGFIQYPLYSATSEKPQFIALVPRQNGGVSLYERKEPSEIDWGEKPWAIVARRLGRVASVVMNKPDDGTLQVVLRVGNRLYVLHHSKGHLPHDLGTDWSAPLALRVAGGKDLSATGDPALISLTEPSSGRTMLLLAVPVRNGLDLLATTGNASNVWNLEQLPTNGRANSVSLLAGNVEGRTDIDVTYRSGTNLLYVWRWLDGPWHRPALVRWEN